MKFKVGNRVKIVKKRTIKMASLGSMDKYLGKVMTIARIDGDWYRMREDNGEWYWNDGMIEGLVQFTKSDLKDGDIVTYRNGEKRTLAGNSLFDNNGITNWLSNYNEDLTREHKERKDTDIIKVERPIQYETVFERKEEILDEAEKRYLRGVIRPFKDRVEYIEKEWCFGNREYIIIAIKDSEELIFPAFKENTKYKNMELEKEYTLEELRTIKE